MSKVSIIGSGYVGSSMGKFLVGTGKHVIFHDINKDTLEKLGKEGYATTLDISNAVSETDISFICVPTPTVSGKIDMGYVEKATEAVGRELKNKSSYHVVAIKSTVLPSTTEEVVKPLLEKASGKKCGEGFGLCANPEFITQVPRETKDPELQKLYHSMPNSSKTYEDKVVIGECDVKSGDIIEDLFKSSGLPIFRVDMKTAEMVKYAHNLHLATRISYWNEIFLICNSLGIDSKTIADIVSTDARIGKYGTVHGKAFGGLCLPKDLEAFVDLCRKKKIDSDVLGAVLKLNKRMAKEYGTRE